MAKIPGFSRNSYVLCVLEDYCSYMFNKAVQSFFSKQGTYGYSYGFTGFSPVLLDKVMWTCVIAISLFTWHHVISCVRLQRISQVTYFTRECPCSFCTFLTVKSSTYEGVIQMKGGSILLQSLWCRAAMWRVCQQSGTNYRPRKGEVD